MTNLGDTPVTQQNQAPGTLRQAIFDANLTVDQPDTIQFAAGLSGTIALSSIDDNAEGPSAIVVSSPITIQGNAAGIQISRAVSVTTRLFRVASTGDLSLDSITLTGGSVQAAPGEIGFGGAIYVSPGGKLQIANSTFHSNEVRSGGSSFGGRGGAVFSNGGFVHIVNSTISGNALFNGSGGRQGFGAGVYNYNGSMWIYNSTFANNLSTAGTGVYSIGDGPGNTGFIRIRNSIVTTTLEETDIQVTYDNGGTADGSGQYNIFHDGDYLTLGAIIVRDPILGPLAANGGPTPTHAVLETQLANQAVDAGDPLFDVNGPDGNPLTADGVTRDQRGTTYARLVDGDGADGARVDIGAFEFAAPLPVPELLGDYNGDHTVNAADYSIWRNTLGSTVDRYSGADGDGNGKIEMADHQVWKSHFGQTLPGAASMALADLSQPSSVTFTIASSPSDPTPTLATTMSVPMSDLLPPAEVSPISPHGRGAALRSVKGLGRVDATLLLLLLGEKARTACTPASAAQAATATGACDCRIGVADGVDSRHALSAAVWDQLWGDWPSRV